MRSMLVLGLIAACASNDRVNALEKRIDKLEAEMESTRDWAAEFRQSVADEGNATRERLHVAGLIDADLKPIARWWCNADGTNCHRSQDACGIGCLPHRIAYCGGDEFKTCFAEGVLCARHNYELASAAKPTVVNCLGVE